MVPSVAIFKLSIAFGLIASTTAVFDLNSLYSQLIGENVDKDEYELSNNYDKLYGQKYNEIDDSNEKFNKKTFKKKTFTENFMGPEATITEFFAEYRAPLTQVNLANFLTSSTARNGRNAFIPSTVTANNGTTFSQVVSFNSNSVILLGALVLAGLLVFPLLSQNFGNNRRSRHLDDTTMIDKINDYVMKNYAIDSKSCMDLIVCSAASRVKSSKENKENKPLENVVDGLLSMNAIKMALKKTKFDKSVNIGTSGYDCDKEYKKCPFSLGVLEKFFNSYLDSMKR